MHSSAKVVPNLTVIIRTIIGLYNSWSACSALFLFGLEFRFTALENISFSLEPDSKFGTSSGNPDNQVQTDPYNYFLRSVLILELKWKFQA